MNVIATIWDWYDFTLFFVAGAAVVGCRQPRRRCFWLRAVGVIALLIGVASVWKALNIGRNGDNNFLAYLEYFLPYLILIFGMWFCFECSFISAFFCATTGYLMQHIAQRVYMTSFILCGWSMDFPFDFLGLTAVSTAVYAAVYFFFIYRNKGNFYNISVDSVWQLFLSALAMLAVIFLDLALSRALRGTETIGIVLCLYTGLRIGELMALQWADIDLRKGVLSVTKTCRDFWRGGRCVRLLDTPKTASSKRGIPVPKQLLPRLRAIGARSASPFVISGKAGEDISLRAYQKMFERFLAREGIPHRGFHALRHTFATRALECGMDVKTLSELLGHKNASITLNRYVHSLLEHKREMMNKLGRLLRE